MFGSTILHVVASAGLPEQNSVESEVEGRA